MKFCFLLMTWVPLASFAAAPAAADSVHHRPITLDEAILLARVQSVDAAVALNELKTAYWEYRTFRADLLPEVNLTATLPSYNKSYNSYQQDDGSYTFVRNNYMQMSGQLSIDQNIWLTGGTLSLNTSLDFLRQMDGTVGNRFMSVPLALTLNQPIFGVNTIKWDRRIEPVRYAEAKAAFLSATEEVTMTTINHFFNLLLARENVNIARQNLANAEKLHEVAKAKRRMGQISENDLLQLELNVLDARSTLTSNESSLKSNMFALRSFLALGEDEELEPVVPDSVPDVLLNYDEVLDKALKNNSFAHNIRRRQLEADYEVAKAKGNMREITLFAQVGFTGTDNRFDSAYRRLKDNQVVEVGFKIPILDWGKRRGQVKVAQSNREGDREQAAPGVDELQPEHLHPGRAVQQPAGPAPPGRRSRPYRPQALPHQRGDFPHRQNLHPRPERLTDTEGRGASQAHYRAVLLLVLLLPAAQPDVVGFCGRHGYRC